MSSSAFPFAFITLPRYLNLSTVSVVLPSTLISLFALSLSLCWMTMTLVLSWLILSPTLAAAFSKSVLIIFKSSTESAVNAISSAKLRSASLFSSFYLMPLFTVSTASLIKKSITNKKHVDSGCKDGANIPNGLNYICLFTDFSCWKTN